MMMSLLLRLLVVYTIKSCSRLRPEKRVSFSPIMEASSTMYMVLRLLFCLSLRLVVPLASMEV